MIRRHFHLPHSWGPRLRPVGVLNSCRRVSGSRAAGQAGYRSPNPEVPTDMGLPNGAPPEAGMLGWSWTVSKHIQHYQIITTKFVSGALDSRDTPSEKGEIILDLRIVWRLNAIYGHGVQSFLCAAASPFCLSLPSAVR